MTSAAHTIDKDSYAGHIEDRQKPKKKKHKRKNGQKISTGNLHDKILNDNSH